MRPSVHCPILPPHILRHVALTARSLQQRERAQRTLDIDQTLRTARLTRSLLQDGIRVPHLAPAAPELHVTLYDAQHGTQLPGAILAHDAPPDARRDDPAPREAYDGLAKTFAFYAEVYRRNSIDDEGLRLDASVHFDQQYDNAFWNGQQMVFGDGDGEIFTRFTVSLDVIGHELTHGVTGSEVNLVYHGQPGALNESLSDVFGSLVKQYAKGQTADRADWLIGAELFTDAVVRADTSPTKPPALRSMALPGTAYDNEFLGTDPQPDHMSKYLNTAEDNGGVHINSGIPNRAFYLAATKIGGKAWEKAGRIWYATLRDASLRATATFQQFAERTVAQAGQLFGTGSLEQAAVTAAWMEVGVPVKHAAPTLV